MTKEELFREISECLKNDYKPSIYINHLMRKGEFDKEPFNMLKKLNEIEQNLMYHPEGSVWNHIMLVVDRASEVKNQSNNPVTFMWGALLHDLGKLTTTKVRRGRITSYNHDVEGENLVYDFLMQLTDDMNFIKKVSKLSRWHMQPLFFDKNLPFLDMEKMIEEIDYKELALISLSDRLGRGNITQDQIEKETNAIKNFIKQCETLIQR